MAMEFPPGEIYHGKAIGCKEHFLDSGAFSLWLRAKKYKAVNSGGDFDYYYTEEYWDYVDAYANFIHKYKIGIDHYANIDVIGNPELTWRNQLYLENEWGLSPIPTIHFETGDRWFHHYIDEKGYKYIAIGGLVTSTSKEACGTQLDRVWETLICNTPDKTPRVKVHGFGVTNFDLLLRYPWYSLDSSRWAKAGGFGKVLVPHKRFGEFVYDKMPYEIVVSPKAIAKNIPGLRYGNMSKMERENIHEWLDEIGVPFGEQQQRTGKRIVCGVSNRHCERKSANLFYFQKLERSLPKYPWPFRGNRRKGGLGIKL